MSGTAPAAASVSDLLADVDEVLRLTQEALGSGQRSRTILDDEIHRVDAALSAARRELLARLDRSDSPGVGLAALLLRAEQVQVAVKDTILGLQLEELESVYTAVNRLRTAVSLEDLADRVPVEAHHIGFTRVLFSRIHQGAWLVRSAFVANDQDMAATLVQVGTVNPRPLVGRLVEGDMVRSGRPILVRNPRTDPRVHPELIAVTETPAYVAAPVYCDGRAIGLVHADRHQETSGVDEFDRNALGVFAESLGMTFERNMILDRLGALRRAADDHLRVADSLADDVTVDVINECGAAHAQTEHLVRSAMAGDRRPPSKEREMLARLTSREHEVLRAMAAGRTNEQIAAALFVSGNTVKSHAKGISRKLGAASRTEAVVVYHRATNPWMAT